MIDIKEAYLFYSKGWSLRKVGALHNLSGERIRQLFIRAGLTTRKQGTYRKYSTCAKGHTLKKGEYRSKCVRCWTEKWARRLRGEHLKKVCKHGHNLTPDNLYHYKWGKDGNKGRRCKTCAKRGMRKYWMKLKRS